MFTVGYWKNHPSGRQHPYVTDFCFSFALVPNRMVSPPPSTYKNSDTYRKRWMHFLWALSQIKRETGLYVGLLIIATVKIQFGWS